MFENKEKTVSKVLEAARRKLLDTGTRNRLVHVNRANSRANCLNVINEQADEVFSILRVNGRKMRFKAMGKDKTAEGQEMLLALPEADLPSTSDRLTDSFLEVPLGPEALARRLLRLATVWNIPVATNVSTADFIIQSPNFNDAADILIPDYARYLAERLK